MHGGGHRLAGDLGIAMRDGDGGFLVQAEQHLRLRIAEIIDDAVVQPAIARARRERDIGDVERAQRVGDHVAAEAGRIGAGRGAGVRAPATAGSAVDLARAVADWGRRHGGRSSGCGERLGADPTGSRALTQPGQKSHAGIAVGRLNAGLALKLRTASMVSLPTRPSAPPVS